MLLRYLTTQGMSDAATTLQCLADRARQLGSLPAVAAKVLELTEQPQVDVRALKQCIEHDPALTAKILRIVNSSLFGLSREVGHLNQALALLGIQPLKLLVLGFSLPPGLYQSVTRDRLAWYWRHALTKAVAARELAEAVWHISGDEPLLAALLQDLGLLVMLQELGSPFARLLEKAEASDLDLAHVQREMLGFDHMALTARILTEWRLPESIVSAVDWASIEPVLDVLPQSRRPLPQLVRLAELLAQVFTLGRASALREFYRLATLWHPLEPHQLGLLVENVQAKVGQLAEVLALDLPPDTDYSQLLVRAQQQLADVAASVVEDLLRGQRTAAPQPCGSAAVAATLLHDELRTLGDAVAEVAKRLQQTPARKPKPLENGSPPPAVAPATASVPAAAPESAPQQPTHGDSDGALMQTLATAVHHCRGWRCPLSLMLTMPVCGDAKGPAAPEQLREIRVRIEQACREDCPDVTLVPYGKGALAVVLPGDDRSSAIHLGQALADSVRQLAGPTQLLGLAVGIATLSHVPPKFPPQELVGGAERCLHASQASGGGVVKSIEMF